VHFEIMFFHQAFSSLVCMILQLVILYYLIKIYRTMEPSENHQQQPVTEARRASDGRMNDIAGRHIRRHAVEQDEREG